MAQNKPDVTGVANQGPNIDIDPIEKFKTLIPRLKESLANLMKIAAQVLHQNAQIDIYLKASDSPMQRLERSLEEFYSLCDQCEIAIRMAQECHKQQQDSDKYTPITVNPSKSDISTTSQDGMSFAQYLNTVKTQISSAKDIHDILLDCASKLTGQTAS